jgi:hypothetical protein
MEEGAVLTTGQSKVFYFNTEQELINKLTQLTGDSNYYQNNLESEFNPIQPPSNPEF